METFTGTEAMGVIYDTETNCAIADMLEFATASGANPAEESIAWLLGATRESYLRECESGGWIPHQIIVDQFDHIRREAIACLRRA
jgi:hypothetical protein